MKFYYIDESMFLNSEFAKQVLFRFERFILKNSATMIFISSSRKENEAIRRFKKTVDHIPVLISPSLFDIEGVRGNLHSTFLTVDEFSIMQSFSGSCVEYDMESKTCRRIYLEMFLEHDDDEDLDSIVEELEQMLSEKILRTRKKTLIS